jgi:hypothetical protein
MFRKNRPLTATSALLLVSLVSFSFVTLPEVQADCPVTRFAAIAYSPLTGRYGYASGATSLADAATNATVNCGATDAQVVAWVQNGWTAFARGADGRTFAYGVSTTSLAGAENMALRGVQRNGRPGVVVAWAASE